MDVVKVQANSIICVSTVGSVGGNVFNQPGGITGGNGNARSNESGAEEVEGAEDLW